MQTRSDLTETMARGSFEWTRKRLIAAEDCGYDMGPWEAQSPVVQEVYVAKARAALAAAEAEGGVFTPTEPTEEQWGGLARQIVMWSRFDRPTGAALHDHLIRCGHAIPGWLHEIIPNVDRVPAKGAVSDAVYRAMLAVSPFRAEA